MIKINNLSYTYPRQKQPVVKNISFEVAKGEILGFLGPSGAGKSTTQKILIRLLHGYQGSATIDGCELTQLRQDYYKRIGVGFELPNHYPRLTALENLRFFASFYEKSCTNLLELLDSVGLKTFANKPTAQFSKGMKMRLNFIRTLLHDPEIIFLDEPTSGLDPVNARIIKNIIMNLKQKGKTIFLTTHNMHDADELCDRVAFITDGVISLIDSPKALKLQHGSRKLNIEYGQNQVVNEEFNLDELAGNQSFLNIISQEKIHAMHTTEASLEDVFIKTTGQSLT
jgi:fluoroquinolone transport system ATP-binding protein